MRTLVFASFVMILLVASWSSADLVTPQARIVDENKPVAIRGQGAFGVIGSFKGNEGAVAIASGSGQTCLELAVFDADGNCVARDDFSGPDTGDDLIVRWVPGAAARYSVEIRNAGIEPNKLRNFAIR